MDGQGISRRELLAAGALAGLGLSAGAGAASARTRLAPGRVTDIEHVVIMIQENRSFDHYFGTYPSVRGFSDSHAISGVFAQDNPANKTAAPVGKLLPFHLDSAAGGECTEDITHAWGAQHQAWNRGAMNHWGEAHAGDADHTYMSYYKRSDLPFYYAVADAFTLCDAYHCSALGSTTGNRLYAMTGMLDPDGLYGGPVTSTIAATSAPQGILDPGWVTYPELLTKSGVSWKYYANPDSDDEEEPLVLFKQYYPENPGVDRVLAAELAANAFAPQFPSDFVRDVAAGTLPSVSWVNASAVQDDHPPDAPNDGQFALATVLRALFSNPAVWARTALFYTFDENGGFFDHVPPPTAPPGTAGEYLKGNPSDPIGLGFRVPLLVISPFSRGGFVARADPTGPDPSHTFDHTSLLRFLETRFGVPVPNLSAWRRAATGDLTEAFNFAAPDFSIPALPAALPDNPLQHPECVQQSPYPTPATQSMPTQEPGRRPSPSGPARRARRR
ncbi:MAG TPA: alkaline phosphatase family protein [Solirubrobacteraceae bacterium]|nr:alkaline phosphatase family protein [Solirubrobacteraceae bacterium]